MSDQSQAFLIRLSAQVLISVMGDGGLCCEHLPHRKYTEIDGLFHVVQWAPVIMTLTITFLDFVWQVQCFWSPTVTNSLVHQTPEKSFSMGDTTPSHITHHTVFVFLSEKPKNKHLHIMNYSSKQYYRGIFMWPFEKIQFIFLKQYSLRQVPCRSFQEMWDIQIWKQGDNEKKKNRSTNEHMVSTDKYEL